MALHLYSNNYTPGYGSVISNFIELVVGGYAAVTLNGGLWTFNSLANGAEGVYTPITWTLTGAATIYGYFVTDLAFTTCYWAELLSGAPFSYSSGGGTFILNALMKSTS